MVWKCYPSGVEVLACGGGVYMILDHESMKRNSQRSQNLTKLKMTQAAQNKMVSLQASCIWLWQVFLIIEELLILQFSKIKVLDENFCSEYICSNSNPSYHISQQLKLLTLLSAPICIPQVHGSCSFSLRVFPEGLSIHGKGCNTMLN